MSDTPKQSVQTIVDELFAGPSHQLGSEDLRIGIFVDRAEGRCAAMILNTTNGKYAFLTKGEHVIEDSDDWDSVMEAVNEACNDIERWSEAKGDV